MRSFDGQILYSATGLMRFMGCAHATAQGLLRLRGLGPEPGAKTEGAALPLRQGDAHEAAQLARLKARGCHVVEIPRGDLRADAQATGAALAQGAEAIFQGAFLGESWGGWSDFLMRVDRPSALGDFSHEVSDTRLKRRPHPKHVPQSVLDSDLLAQILGVMPHNAYVELGDGTRARRPSCARRRRRRCRSLMGRRCW